MSHQNPQSSLRNFFREYKTARVQKTIQTTVSEEVKERRRARFSRSRILMFSTSPINEQISRAGQLSLAKTIAPFNETRHAEVRMRASAARQKSCTQRSAREKARAPGVLPAFSSRAHVICIRARPEPLRARGLLSAGMLSRAALFCRGSFPPAAACARTHVNAIFSEERERERKFGGCCWWS